MKRFSSFISEDRPKKIDQYTPAPPKPPAKPPRTREQNLSGPLEKHQQRLVAIQQHNDKSRNVPNKKVNDRILGMYAGDTDKDKTALTESYDFNIAKPSGFGTFLTAADLGIKANPGFHLHPSVEEELEEQANCKKNKRKEYQKKIIDD
jgi:hypothetical protein